MHSYARDPLGSGRGPALRAATRGCARRSSGMGHTQACRRGAADPELLPFDEEVELARRAREGELSAIDRIVRAHLRPLRRLALKLRWYGVPIDDLVQEGVLGLLHSLPRFEPARNVRLLTFSAHAVRLRMIRAIVEDRALGTASRDTSWGRRFFWAEETGARFVRRTSLPSAPSTTPGSGSFSYVPLRVSRQSLGVDIDVDSDHDARVSGHTTPQCDPERAFGNEELGRFQREHVRSALERLSDRERMIVEQRSMADDPMSYRDLARSLGISGERVKQIHVRALEKLRDHLRPLDAESI